jgi:hypothetical protein
VWLLPSSSKLSRLDRSPTSSLRDPRPTRFPDDARLPLEALDPTDADGLSSGSSPEAALRPGESARLKADLSILCILRPLFLETEAGGGKAASLGMNRARFFLSWRWRGGREKWRKMFRDSWGVTCERDRRVWFIRARFIILRFGIRLAAAATRHFCMPGTGPKTKARTQT